MLGFINRYSCAAGISCTLFLAIFSCGMGPAVSDHKAPMTLEALFASYGIPSDCGSAAVWENQQVTILGYVDHDNVFDKQRFPHLPYEKFRMIDRKGRSIEVWVETAESRPIFTKLYQKTSPIIVRGRLSAAKIFVTGKCLLTAKVWIDDATQIQ